MTIRNCSHDTAIVFSLEASMDTKSTNLSPLEIHAYIGDLIGELSELARASGAADLARDLDGLFNRYFSAEERPNGGAGV
mgnify:CR=1 FL=1